MLMVLIVFFLLKSLDFYTIQLFLSILVVISVVGQDMINNFSCLKNEWVYFYFTDGI